jgi:exonuclease III
VPKKSNGRPLCLINVNCQSLIAKKAAWIDLLESSQPDVIIATETWLDSEVTDAELECSDFTIYRKDRAKGKHGGTMIAINNNINSSPVNISPTPSSDLLFVKIHCKGHKDIIIGACYRPYESDKTTLPELRT